MILCFVSLGNGGILTKTLMARDDGIEDVEFTEQIFTEPPLCLSLSYALFSPTRDRQKPSYFLEAAQLERKQIRYDPVCNYM